MSRDSGLFRSTTSSSASCLMLCAPDQIAIAVAAMGQLEEENRQLERQWTLRASASFRSRAGAPPL